MPSAHPLVFAPTTRPIWLPAAALVWSTAFLLSACEPATPLPASDAGPPVDAAPDRDRPPPDAEPGCPDDDEDGVRRADCAEPGQLADCDDTDPTIRPGASDPCGDQIDQNCDGADTRCPDGCVPGEVIDPCDPIDDDCDGLVDECDTGQLCEEARCVGRAGAPCGPAQPCARGSACVDDLCVPFEPGGICEDDTQCAADAFCGDNDACDPIDARCYALQGGRCEASCDCGGRWVCDDTLGRCTTCLIDGQCDGGARCTAAGLCATPTALGGPGEALDQLISELLACRARFADAGNAEGCARLDTGPLFAGGESIGALAPPAPDEPRVCDAEQLGARGYDPDAIATIRELFGCEAPSRLDWNAPIPAEREGAACISHLPPWARSGQPDEGLTIAPCGAVVYARQTP